MPKAWRGVFHTGVISDLQSLGKISAGRVLKIIEASVMKDPSLGGLLGPEAPGCRLFKSDGFHILYQLDDRRSLVFVLAVRQESGNGQKVKTHREVG